VLFSLLCLLGTVAASPLLSSSFTSSRSSVGFSFSFFCIEREEYFLRFFFFFWSSDERKTKEEE
jgi:hypothetical protein